MTTPDVERVARLLAEIEGHTWNPWFAEQYGDDYRKQARAAMAATLELAAEDLLNPHAEFEIDSREEAADWLLSRANELKEEQ